MKKIVLFAALTAMSLAPVRGLAAAPAPSQDNVEKELTAILGEMDALRAELDRIEELARTPKATGVRIEIVGEGNVTPPASVRIVVGGRVEGEREWGKAERNAFPEGGVPLTATVPLLPGSYAARVELYGPAWKSALAVDVPLEVRTGQTAGLRLKLAAVPGSPVPALRRVDAGTP